MCKRCVLQYSTFKCVERKIGRKKTVFAWTFEQSVINSATNLNTSQVRRISEMISSHINHEYVKFYIDDKMSKFELRWKNFSIWFGLWCSLILYWKVVTFQESSLSLYISRYYRIYILSQFLHLIMLADTGCDKKIPNQLNWINFDCFSCFCLQSKTTVSTKFEFMSLLSSLLSIYTCT